MFDREVASPLDLIVISRLGVINAFKERTTSERGVRDRTSLQLVIDMRIVD
jgi:hypothetical protein